MTSRVLCLIVLASAMLWQSIGLSAQDSALEVVASHSILADVARNIAGERIQVRSLIPVGADPHAFIPSPGDLTTVAEAELVFINGAGFEEGLLAAVEGAGEMVNIVVVSACIQLRPFGAATHSEDDHNEDDQMDEHDDGHADDHEDDHADDQDDEHDDDDDHADDHDGDMGKDCDDHDAEFAAIVGEEEEDHAHFATLGRAEDIDCAAGRGQAEDGGHGHDEGACDPHVWMDPHNVIYWLLMIRDTLAAIDHDNAETYAANAAQYARELVALEADFILPALEDLPEDRRILVTSHESLGYLATTFGFEIVTTVVPGMSTMVEPSARDVAALIDTVRDRGVPAIFSDTNAPENIMQTIAAETGAALVGLYSDTLSDNDGPAGSYLELMRFNVTTIVNALTGD